MKITGQVAKFLLESIVAFLLVCTLAGQDAYCLSLDFDSIDASAGNVDPTSYLAGQGVVLTNNSPASNVVIVDYRNFFDVIPPSLPNFITQLGSNDPVSYTMTFNRPLESLSFTRTRLVDPGGLAYPEWLVTVYNASGVSGPSVGDSLKGYYGDNPAVTYTLAIPNDLVKSVVVYSNNHNFAGMSAVTLDDFQGNAVPLPPTLLLLGGGLLGLVGLGRFSKE